MRSVRLDISELPFPIDAWTRPFWDAAAREELILPRCGECLTWRWPPTPFCPKCRSQELDWKPAGQPRVYSYTIVRRPRPDAGGAPDLIVPALVEFPEAGNVRLVAAIVDSEIDAIEIGAKLAVDWTAKDGTKVPVFRVA